MFKNKTYQYVLVLFLLVGAGFMKCFFYDVPKIGSFFNHFLYIPVVLACFWWKRKGIFVAISLSAMLIFVHLFYGSSYASVGDIIRALMLLLIAHIIVALNERLDTAKTALKETEKLYRAVFENTGTAMIIIDNGTRISLANHEFEKLSGYSRTEIEGNKSWQDFVSSRDLHQMRMYHIRRRHDSKSAPNSYEFQFMDRNKKAHDIFVTIDMIHGTQKSVASLADVTKLKRALEDQKELQKRLSEALTKVLAGYIPICSNCKKIRKENGAWTEVESYISRHTSADFTHSICPDCIKKLYPEIADDTDK